MSQKLDQLQEAVDKWYDRAKAAAEAEATFLEKLASQSDDITLAETRGSETFSNLIADTIAELLA